MRKLRRICFKRSFISKILRGEKTQTRRPFRSNNNFKVGEVLKINNSNIHILISHKYAQKLGEISSEEIRKEGFSSPEEFQEAWKRIYGEWDPEQQVWVYEFKLLNPENSTQNLKITHLKLKAG